MMNREERIVAGVVLNVGRLLGVTYYARRHITRPGFVAFRSSLPGEAGPAHQPGRSLSRRGSGPLLPSQAQAGPECDSHARFAPTTGMVRPFVKHNI